MTTREDWSAAAAAFAADRRADLAHEVPEPETLEAFYRGELPEAEADLVRDFLACHPEIARAFADDLDDEMPNVAPDSPLAATPSERAAGWKELAGRLGLPSEEQAAPLRFAPAHVTKSALPSRRDRLAIAASLGALLFLGLYGLKTREIAELKAEISELKAEIAKPRIEVDHPLRPTNTRGPSMPNAVQIAPERLGSILRIDLPAIEPQSAPSEFQYRVEVFVVGGETPLQAWMSLVPTSENVLRLRIAHGSFPLGTYEVRVFGTGPSGETTQASYGFEIVDRVTASAPSP